MEFSGYPHRPSVTDYVKNRQQLIITVLSLLEQFDSKGASALYLMVCGRYLKDYKAVAVPEMFVLLCGVFQEQSCSIPMEQIT